MSDLVKVKVQRTHTNDLGTHVEGEEYETTPAHAKLLDDRNIVTILGAVKSAPAPETKPEEAPPNKADKPPVNKAKARPANKAATAPQNKAAVTHSTQ